MKFSDAENMTKTLAHIMGYSALANKALAIMIFCSANENWSPDIILIESRYSEDEIGTILCNLIDQKYLDFANHTLIIEGPKNPSIDWLEFISIAIKVTVEPGRSAIVKESKITDSSTLLPQLDLPHSSLN